MRACGCGACLETRRQALARLIGWKVMLKELALRMRRSRCGRKAAEAVAVARPRPRAACSWHQSDWVFGLGTVIFAPSLTPQRTFLIPLTVSSLRATETQAAPHPAEVWLPPPPNRRTMRQE